MTNTSLVYNQIYNMDCLEGLKMLDSDSISCVCTSPPYWALRDYGVPGQIGQEDTPQEYIDRLCAVFEEVRRVLRPDGVCWIVIADTYCGTGNKADYFDPKNPKGRTGQKKAKNYRIPGLKKKDLIGIPWMLAFAMRNAGWYLRQEIVWHKSNAMPESVTDRCVKAHESVFLFAKSQRYYFNQTAIMEPMSETGMQRLRRGKSDKNKYAGGVPGQSMQAIHRAKPGLPSDEIPRLRNRRTVWSVGTQPLAAPHFAAFPRALIEPCILAGCPPDGVVLDPFMGSGTTAMTAYALGRKYIGFELNPEYITIAEKRIKEGK